jgi:hypothetical protein
LYMRRFVLGWKKLGHEKRLQACENLLGAVAGVAHH